MWLEYSESVLDIISGDGLGDNEYGLLVERSLRARTLESLLESSLWRFNSRCSGVRLPRGGLEEIDLAYIGISFSSYGFNVPFNIGGLICCGKN